MIFPSASGDFDLTDDMVEAFQLKYPHTNAREECLKASLWLYRNPAKRPVYPLRYIANWLKKQKPKTVQMRVVGGSKMTEHELLALASKLGTAPRPGEGWSELGRRLALLADQKGRVA